MTNQQLSETGNDDRMDSEVKLDNWMMEPGETDLIQSRRGSENSQAKEPAPDKLWRA